MTAPFLGELIEWREWTGKRSRNGGRRQERGDGQREDKEGIPGAIWLLNEDG